MSKDALEAIAASAAKRIEDVFVQHFPSRLARVERVRDIVLDTMTASAKLLDVGHSPASSSGVQDEAAENQGRDQVAQKSEVVDQVSLASSGPDVAPALRKIEPDPSNSSPSPVPKSAGEGRTIADRVLDLWATTSLDRFEIQKQVGCALSTVLATVHAAKKKGDPRAAVRELPHDKPLAALRQALEEKKELPSPPAAAKYENPNVEDVKSAAAVVIEPKPRAPSLEPKPAASTKVVKSTDLKPGVTGTKADFIIVDDIEKSGREPILTTDNTRILARGVWTCGAGIARLMKHLVEGKADSISDLADIGGYPNAQRLCERIPFITEKLEGIGVKLTAEQGIMKISRLAVGAS